MFRDLRIFSTLIALVFAIIPALLAAQERSTVERKILIPVNPTELQLQELERQRTAEAPTPLQFAIGEPVSFTPANSGQWTENDDGRLWRLNIVAPGALSINLGITDMELPEGASLTIADPDRAMVQGPYTREDISRKGRLFTAIIENQEIIVELTVPRDSSEPQFEIFVVNKGFIDFSSGGALKSGSCNNDVICPVGNGWRDQIRSVARYSINGSGLCTGTLMNNTSFDFTPYFLSANHCGVNAGNDDTLVFYWNYESANCGDQGGGDLTDNQNGAFFRASSAASDFVLVELEDTPTVGSNVFYSGWDATGNISPSTVAIHHPSGDEKAISFNTDALTSTGYLSNAADATATHWRVDDWEDGTTEPGSSGSCLWDAATQRCIGTLHGGYAACAAPNDSDWYGKFSSSWTGGGTNATRLRNWLDPGNTGSLTLNGDPHLMTLDGVRYDFQGAGEFVALKDIEGTEVQVRQSPISTSFVPGPNPYHGLATCVSLNTAVAAQVGKHRVTYQQTGGKGDENRLILRIDGKELKLDKERIPLPDGGVIVPVDREGAIVVEFPGKYALAVTPDFWSSQGAWYLNVSVVRRPVQVAGGLNSASATIGVGGLNAEIASGSWLPPLPDGSSVGTMPASLQDRYDVLYEKFGRAWRVTDATSLFDYAAGETTATFTDPAWPQPDNNASCPVADAPTVEKPIDEREAAAICREFGALKEFDDCIFDVAVTGHAGFARTYFRSILLLDQIKR